MSEPDPLIGRTFPTGADEDLGEGLRPPLSRRTFFLWLKLLPRIEVAVMPANAATVVVALGGWEKRDELPAKYDISSRPKIRLGERSSSDEE